MTRGVLGAGIERVATAVLAAGTVGLIWIVPDSPLEHLGEPCYLALFAYAGTLVILAGLRPLGARGRRHERLLLAVFLAGMPLVYVANALVHGAGVPLLLIELAGVVLYGTLAWFGGAGSFRLLALGITAHGVWDLAHHGQADVVPDWYPIACTLIDFALGFLVWSRRDLPPE